MLIRTGTVTAVAAERVTVTIEPQLICQTCPGCSGIQESKLNLSTPDSHRVDDKVAVGIDSRRLRQLTFYWFALPVLVFVAVLFVVEKYLHSEQLATLFASAIVASFYWLLVSVRSQSSYIYQVTTLLNNR